MSRRFFHNKPILHRLLIPVVTVAIAWQVSLWYSQAHFMADTYNRGMAEQIGIAVSQLQDDVFEQTTIGDYESLKQKMERTARQTEFIQTLQFDHSLEDFKYSYRRSEEGLSAMPLN